MSLENQIDQCFAGYIGQERIIENVKGAILGYAHGLRLPSFAFFGASGIGKTEIMVRTDRALALAIEALAGADSAKSTWFDSCDRFATIESEGFEALKTAIESARPLVIFLDEIQDLYLGYKGPTKTAFHQFIKQSLDASAANGKDVYFKDIPEAVRVCHKTVSINIGTNFPDNIDDKEAINRRFSVQHLDLYTPEQISKITKLKLEKKGIRADERTLGIVGRCGRGTCEGPDKISEKLAEIAVNHGKKTVNKDDVLAALKSLQMFPRGLTKREIEILKYCSGQSVKTSQLSIVLKCQTKGVKDAVANLMSQTNEENNVCPMISDFGGKFKTTKFGARYLESLKADKFNV